MKRTKNTLFVSMLLCISFSLNGCEDKQTDTSLPVENTTEIIGTEDTDISQNDTHLNQKKTLGQTSLKGKTKNAKKSIASGRLLFVDRNGTKYRFIMQKGKLLPDPKSKPILLINLFDIHDHASLAQIPYLTELQNEYGKHLTILGIPTNQSLSEEELKTFISMHQIDYYISYDSNLEAIGDIFSDLLDIDDLTTPTTLLYHNGEPDAIYEGAAPIEMITHDILMINKE